MGLQTVEELEDVVEMAQVPGDGKGEFFAAMPEEEVDAGQDVFAALVQSREANAGQVDKFVAHCAEVYKMSPEEIKAKASVNPDNFFGAFDKWVEKQPAKKTRGKAKEEPPKPAGETIIPEPKAEQPPTSEPPSNAMNYEGPRPIAQEHITKIREMLKKVGVSEDMVRQEFEVVNLEAMTYEQGINCMDWLHKMK